MSGEEEPYAPLQRLATTPVSESSSPPVHKSIVAVKNQPRRKKSVGFRPPSQLELVMPVQSEEEPKREEDDPELTKLTKTSSEEADEVAVDASLKVRPPTPPGVSHRKVRIKSTSLKLL